MDILLKCYVPTGVKIDVTSCKKALLEWLGEVLCQKTNLGEKVDSLDTVLIERMVNEKGGENQSDNQSYMELGFDAEERGKRNGTKEAEFGRETGIQDMGPKKSNAKEVHENSSCFQEERGPHIGMQLLQHEEPLQEMGQANPLEEQENDNLGWGISQLSDHESKQALMSIQEEDHMWTPELHSQIQREEDGPNQNDQSPMGIRLAIMKSKRLSGKEKRSYVKPTRKKGRKPRIDFQEITSKIETKLAIELIEESGTKIIDEI